MLKFWNERYENDAYVYGKEPNQYLKEALVNLKLPARILFPAEGEGRNAVFAAKAGFDVTAFDISDEGKNKAKKLADAYKVKITYKVGVLSEHKFEDNSFDAIALIYAHFPANLKSQYHKQLAKLLKKDGILIFEAFSKNNIEQKKKYPQIGGPINIDMLFSMEEIKQDFNNFEILELKEEIIPLNEGIYHNGMGAVIRFIGKKRV